MGDYNIAVILVAKKTIWLRLFFTKLDLLLFNQQYAKSKIFNSNISSKTIKSKQNTTFNKKKKEDNLYLDKGAIFLKNDNQISIFLAPP